MNRAEPKPATSADANASGAVRSPSGSPSRHDSVNPPSVPDHELLRCIGRGSYGEVWLARNVLGEFRAVKVIYRSAFEHERPYQREFEGIQKFEPISREHESQVDILHVGRNDKDGYFYYVMELADDANVGQASSLSGPRENVAAGAEETGATPVLRYTPHTLKHDLYCHTRLPVDDCLRIGLALTTALEHLHSHGLVHRDIKPSNIIFVNGTPKLADIGLVASMDATMSFVGTSGFLPPEGPGTPQGDLYSLGKVLYEMSMGRDRQDFPKLPANLAEFDDPPRLLELNAVILKACAHNPHQRYQSAQAMAADLALLQRGQSVKRKRAVECRWILARKLSLAAALTLLATGAWLLFNRFDRSTIPRINGVPEVNSIAVLPFVNQGSRAQLDYLADVLSDETMNALTNVAGLRVAPRSAVFAFKRATNDVRQIGVQLGVRTVLAGSMMKKSSNQLYVTARLINVTDGGERWSATYDRYRSSTNVREVAIELVSDVARVLKVSISDSALRQMETNFTHKLAAYKFYSQTRSVRDDTTDGLNRILELLNHAIAEDRDFAQCHAKLAYYRVEMSGWMLPPKQAMPEAKKNALDAIRLDDSLAEAHTALAIVFASHELDFAKAEAEFQHAIAVDPRYVSSYTFYALLLSRLERFQDAEQTLNRGNQIFPNHKMIFAGWCWRYYLERRFDEMLEAATNHLSVSPDDAIGLMFQAWAQEGLGRYDDALATAQKLVQLVPSADDIALLGRVHARMGHHDETQKALEELRVIAQTPRGSPLFSAQVLLALGNEERALEQLQQAVDDYPPLAFSLKTDPLWDELRSDQRFQALVKKMERKE